MQREEQRAAKSQGVKVGGESIAPELLSGVFAAFMRASSAHQTAGGNPPASVNPWPTMN
jgi:hypothetical protein